MNRRKFFSFVATAPVATVIGAKAAMDANGNGVAPLVGDFWENELSPSEFNEYARQYLISREDLSDVIYRIDPHDTPFLRQQDTDDNLRS